MRTEAEVRAAMDDLQDSVRKGLVPPEARLVVLGELEALRFVLGEEVPGVANLSATLEAVRSFRNGDVSQCR